MTDETPKKTQATPERISDEVLEEVSGGQFAPAATRALDERHVHVQKDTPKS